MKADANDLIGTQLPKTASTMTVTGGLERKACGRGQSTQCHDSSRLLSYFCDDVHPPQVLGNALPN